MRVDFNVGDQNGSTLMYGRNFFMLAKNNRQKSPIEKQKLVEGLIRQGQVGTRISILNFQNSDRILDTFKQCFKFNIDQFVTMNRFFQKFYDIVHFRRL